MQPATCSGVAAWREKRAIIFFASGCSRSTPAICAEPTIGVATAPGQTRVTPIR
jgi:hypothetical protein